MPSSDQKEESRRHAHSLRTRAEFIIQKLGQSAVTPSSLEVKELLEELTIHQVELELQGQELSATSSALSKSNQNLLQYFRHAPVPILRLDRDGAVLECNLACRALLVTDPTRDPRRLQVLFESRLTPASRRVWKALLQRLHHQTDTASEEIELLLTNGNIGVFCVTGVQVEPGESIIYLQDITSLQRTTRENERLALIAQRTLNAVIFTDAHRRIEWVNDGFTRMTGYEPEEVLGKTPSLLQGPGTDPATVRFMRTALDQGQGFQVEILNYTKSGQSYWIQLEVTPLHNEDGVLTGFFAIQTDITARKQREAELLRLRTAVEQSPTPFVITDLEGTINYVNPAFCKKTGYELEEVLGQNPRILKSGEHGRDFYAALWDDLLSGRVWAGTLHNRRKDGSLFWVYSTIAPILDDKNVPFGFIAIMQDITLQKNLQEQLEVALVVEKRRSNFIADLLKALPVGIIVRALDGSITHTNPAAAELTGYSQEELLALPVSKRETPEIMQQVAEEDELLLSGQKEVLRRERTMRHREGHDLSVLVTKALIHNETGKVDGIISAIIDISAIKELERNLRESKLAAEAASRAKSAFLATMSHEIRTPLNAVIGMASLLAECELGSEENDYVQTILTASQNLLDLINDILDYSRIENDKLILHAEEFLLEDLLLEPLQIMQQPAHSKGLALEHFIDPDIPAKLHGDRMRLRQILLNLISNAVKFTRKGSVTLAVKLVGTTTEHCEVEFSVRDTGIGISPETQAQLFHPFVQADSSITREFGGTGLGLAISHQLCELMGGRIWVESELGRGSVFRMRIPFAVPEKQAPMDGLLPDLRGRRLLCVDASATGRELIRRFVEKWAGVFCGASSPAEATALLTREKPFDFIFTAADFALPEWCQFFAAIDALPQSESACFLWLVPPGSEADEDTFGRFSAKLEHPLRPSRLAAALQACAQDSRPAQKVNPVLRRALLAEDNPYNQLVLRRMLEHCGFECMVVENGAEAVQAVLTEHKEGREFQVVMLDLQMPVMDGLTAARELRKSFSGAPRRPALLAVTANSFAQDEKEALASGFDFYLAEPVSLEQFKALLARVEADRGKSPSLHEQGMNSSSGGH